MSYNYDGDGQPCCPTSRPCSAHDVLEPCPHICPQCAKCPDCCGCHEQARADLELRKRRADHQAAVRELKAIGDRWRVRQIFGSR